MRTRLAAVAVLIALIVASAFVEPGSPADAQDGAQATISALQTRVAELEATITALSAEGTPTVALGNQTVTFRFNWTGQPAHEWQIAVTGVEIAQEVGELEGSNPEHISTARGKFVIVRHTVTNLGNAPDAFPDEPLVLRDGSGREFSYDFGATFDYCYYSLDFHIFERLQPGLEYEWATVFDVPESASGFSLTTEDSEFVIDLAQ